MNIFCVDSPYANALRNLGHNVLAPKFEEGILYIPSVLEAHDFKPDLFIQHERLSARLILGGLHKIPCPTVFVSIDAHLNMFWHKFYGKLFDVVLTPHVSLYKALNKAERLPAVRRFAPTGYNHEFTPYAEREHTASFVGVLTKHRPARTDMVELLTKHCALYRPDSFLQHKDMLTLFANSAIVPNESIALEVNFRLFEAASCGALVISQDIGEDQNAHFTPGVECETYANALELIDKISYYIKNLEAAQKIGKAGWERVQKEHLPIHRAERLAASAKTSQYRASGEDANLYFYLTLLQMARIKSHPLPAEWFFKRWSELPKNSMASAAKLQLLLECSNPANAMYSSEYAEKYKIEANFILAEALKDNLHTGSLEFNLTAAMGAVLFGDLNMAKAFWLRQVQSLALQNADFVRFINQPLSSRYEHFVAWGKLLVKLGKCAQPGFGFRPDSGFIPASAFECALLAQNEAPKGRMEWLALMHSICSVERGFTYWDMGFLAQMSLAAPQNWQLQMQYGVSCIVNYRPDSGLFELAEARKTAIAAGEENSFISTLEAFASSRYISGALHKFNTAGL
ncbi:glycosyltransferase [Desulfovibrio sp. OttesenSCG-928-F07]|nr:glycosyltransferase [Desulfovibrio sp. OttesenSCG-928-F07]